MSLEIKIKNAIISSKDYSKFLQNLSVELNKQCKTANSEETIAIRIETCLNKALSIFGIEYNPVREVSLSETIFGRIKNKRIDSKYENIVFEYKKNINKDLEKFINQLKSYLFLLAENEKQSIDRYVGILIDGQACIFINFENSELNISQKYTVNGNSLKEIISILLSLDKKSLSSQNLLKDFSIFSDNRVMQNLIKVLYSSLDNPNDRTYMLHSEWKRIFSIGTNNENNMKLIRERKAALANCFDISVNNFNETKGLFALQTAYTIIIKLIAYYIVAEIFFKTSDMSIKDLLKLDYSGLRNRLEDLENGEIFKQLGINNLLEGDFFSWYVYENTWNNDIYNSIKDCIGVLSQYDGNKNLFQKNCLHDLFIDLYQEIMPIEVRHSLGEYYTPSWLAEHVIKNIPKNEKWNGIDPCAGSGTFVLEMIKQVALENKDKNNKQILREILNRVKAIDINPLAVLTCRLNYFFAISNYINETMQMEIEIPVYLGDSAFVPELKEIDNIKVISYVISTQKGPMKFLLPVSIITNTPNITNKIIELENAIQNLDKDSAISILCSILSKNDKKDFILDAIEQFASNLIFLEKQNWDRIWVRIIISFLKIATLEKFSIIVGNPPWIDWKTLPEGYRNTLKSICIDRNLFSGDNFTGGINLNICALICSVVSNNWLKQNGYLAFLMPKSMALQQSYSGFRRLVQKDGINLKYVKFHDWSNAGKPFNPVTEKFMTYVLQKTKNECEKYIPTISYILEKGKKIPQKSTMKQAFELLNCQNMYAIQNSDSTNNFIFNKDIEKLDILKNINGKCEYCGRVGLGIYPKELLLFEYKQSVNNNIVILENFQGKTTEKKFIKKNTPLETQFLHPVIESPNIEKFGISGVKFYSPFPYNQINTKIPIEANLLKKQSPLLYQFYQVNKNNLKKTSYNNKVQGNKGEFYSLTRVGKYSFAKHRVVFRNNSKWVAAVINDGLTPWGETKSYLLLDHACSISQDRNGNFITEDEAHYICSILNSKLINEYIINSSDSRSYKTDIPIKIPKYDKNNLIHKKLSILSKKAHKAYIDKISTEKFEKEINTLVIEIYKNYTLK